MSSFLDSSCPDPPSSPCGWDNINNPGSSPQILKGALVGGPDVNDNYADNHVGCDFNAGFQSALAGIVMTNIINFIKKCFFYKYISNALNFTDAYNFMFTQGCSIYRTMAFYPHPRIHLRVNK